MATFVVQQRDRAATATPEFLVVNLDDRGRPVASFATRAEAEAHAEKLNAGPLDWDEQEQWQDDDWGEDGAEGAPAGSA